MKPWEDHIVLCGHRGTRCHGLENTMPAFRFAVEAGCEMVETDVHMTKDHELILMHNDTADATTDGTGLICEKTLAEMRGLNAAINAVPSAVTAQESILRVPPATLKELIAFAKEYPNLWLNVELKDYPLPGREEWAYECADLCVGLLIDSGLESRIIINSFSGKLLEYVYKKYGRRFLYHGFYPWFILGEMDTNPASFIDIAAMQHRYQTADGDVVKYEEPLCPQEWFHEVTGTGVVPLLAPSLKEYWKYEKGLKWGARIICTDDPAAMTKFLKSLAI